MLLIIINVNILWTCITAVKPDPLEPTSYKKHHDALVKYATPITGCRAHAEDIVQEAYLKVLPTKKTNTISYMYRVVRNLAIDLVRRSSMEGRLRDSEKITWLEPKGVITPEESSSQQDDLSKISYAFDQLPELEKQALSMHRIDGYTMLEIAKRLNISVSTVHRLIKSAVVALGQSLDNE